MGGIKNERPRSETAEALLLLEASHSEDGMDSTQKRQRLDRPAGTGTGTVHTAREDTNPCFHSHGLGQFNDSDSPILRPMQSWNYTGYQDASGQHSTSPAADMFHSISDGGMTSLAHSSRCAQESSHSSSSVTGNTHENRIERKRKLEKQRRSDINRQFALLQDTVASIESSDDISSEQLMLGVGTYSPSNRVELIARTIHLLNYLNDSRKKQRSDIEGLQERLEASKKAGEEAAAKAKEKFLSPQVVADSSGNGNQMVVMVVVE